MSTEPTTEAGQALNKPRFHFEFPMCSRRVRSDWPCSCGHTEKIIAIEQEARSDSDLELREALLRQVWHDVFQAMRMENVSEEHATARADLVRIEVENFFANREATKVRELHSERKS